MLNVRTLVHGNGETEMVKEKEILYKVKSLLQDSRNWTKGELANTTSPRDDDAGKWCLAGAIAKFDPEVEIRIEDQAIRGKNTVYKRLLGIYPTETIHDFNDRAGYNLVMQVLRKATTS